eukprot:3331412-Rhodomonas_salina.9
MIPPPSRSQVEPRLGRIMIMPDAIMILVSSTPARSGIGNADLLARLGSSPRCRSRPTGTVPPPGLRLHPPRFQRLRVPT